MKKTYVAAATVPAALKEEIEGLAEVVLYDTWDEYPEASLEDVIDMVNEHIELIVTEMDDDETHVAVKDLIEKNRSRFDSIVKKYVKAHYNDYEWYDE